VCLEFVSENVAAAALRACGDLPVLISESMAVFCVSGKMRTEYVADGEEDIPGKMAITALHDPRIVPAMCRSLEQSVCDTFFG
jgi:hypothetical protein